MLYAANVEVLSPCPVDKTRTDEGVCKVSTPLPIRCTVISLTVSTS
jgi:hypothetical protein